MSVTIVSTPVSGSPAYSPNIYTVTSSNVAQDDLKYIAQIYDGSDLLGELKSVPHPVDGWGKFNISNVVSAELSAHVDFETTPAYSATSSVKSIDVKFGESYGTGSGFTRTTASAQDSKEYFNGSPFYEEFVDIHSSASSGNHPYRLTSGVAYKKYPLTSRRTVQTVEGTKQWLYYYSTDRDYIRNIEVRDDVSLATASIALPASISSDALAKVVAFRVDSDIIEASSSLSDLEEWSVRTTDASDNPTSEYISFSLMECSHWDLYSLYYLNRFGGVDSFSFNGRISREISDEKKTYRILPETINSSGQVSYSTSKHRSKPYFVTYGNTYTLNSGWITEAQQDSAIDLQTSPLVWMEKPNGVIVPVTISQNSLRIKNRKDGVISVRMEVEQNEITNRQQV